MTTNEIGAASIQRVVVAHFRKIMNAERCTLMLLDSATETLYFRDWEQDAHEGESSEPDFARAAPPRTAMRTQLTIWISRP